MIKDLFKKALDAPHGQRNALESEAYPRVAGCELAEEMLREFGVGNFAKNVEIGNELNRLRRHQDALYFFRRAYDINPQSSHVLLRILETQLFGGMEISTTDLDALRNSEPAFARFFEARRAQSEDKSPQEVLAILSNAFESFASGAEADWFFLRCAMKLVANPPLPNAENPARANLFFYWDKPDPPEEVAANIQFHRDLGIFDVKPFSRQSATDFLYDYYGRDTADLFRKLRHPSEESDFARFHLTYAFGGYYLDVDEQVISVDRFRSQFGSALTDVFILSASGPVESAFFGATKHSQVIERAIRVLTHNCYLRPNLSMWLKSGPGPITRALLRTYYLHLTREIALPNVHLLDTVTFPNAFRAIPVSYRGDARDWRVFEAQLSK